MKERATAVDSPAAAVSDSVTIVCASFVLPYGDAPPHGLFSSQVARVRSSALADVSAVAYDPRGEVGEASLVARGDRGREASNELGAAAQQTR